MKGVMNENKKKKKNNNFCSTQRVHFERTPRIGMLSLKAINFRELRFVPRSRIIITSFYIYLFSLFFSSSFLLLLFPILILLSRTKLFFDNKNSSNFIYKLWKNRTRSFIQFRRKYRTDRGEKKYFVSFFSFSTDLFSVYESNKRRASILCSVAAFEKARSEKSLRRTI